MPYCTLFDLKKLIDEPTLTQLSDLENSGSLDESVIDEAIKTADAQIDSYIANKVQEVPLTTVPTLINKISAKMTIHELYTNRMTGFPPESVNDWYKDCLRQLEAIRSGKMQLNIELSSRSEGEYRVNKTPDSMIFSQETLDKY